MPHLQEIKIEASPDQYKRAAKKERRGGGRYHTLPISFQEIKVVIVVLIISSISTITSPTALSLSPNVAKMAPKRNSV